MAHHDLYPSFVQIHYRSAWGKHVQTIQTRQWSLAGFTHGFGGYTDWAGAPVQADDMIFDYLNLVKLFCSDGVTFDECVVFNYPAPIPALPNPVSVFPVTTVGTIASVPASQALQMTNNFYDSAFNPFKIILLDVDCTGHFAPSDFASLTVAKQNLMNYFTGSTHAFASRADLKPTIFRQTVWKYNDKLRKEYHLV